MQTKTLSMVGPTMSARVHVIARRFLLLAVASILTSTLCQAQMKAPVTSPPALNKSLPVQPKQDKVDKATNLALITVLCYNSVPGSFSVTLYNTATGTNYYFTSTSASDTLGVVPDGDYIVFMSNPSDQSTWWNYYACGQTHYGNTADFFNVPINSTWRVLEINQ